MLKLYGIAISNYYCTVKAALVAKGLAFESVTTMPEEKPGIVEASPMGKVPYIETERGFLSETNVIFDYLEEVYPEPPLWPAEAWARAKAREVSRLVELYLDSPVRPLLPTVYFGAPLDEAAASAARPQVEKGLRAFTRLARLDRYLAGDAVTYADIDAFFQVGFTNLHTREVWDWDICDAVPGLSAYLERVAAFPAVASVAAEQEQAFNAFRASRR